MACILLAEDDDSVRYFLARSLENAGHEVMAFADGEDALPILEAGPFDILITDIVMPGMSGIELAKLAKKVRSTLPVIFITGFSAVNVEALDTVKGVSQVISKPFHLNSLVDAVDQVLYRNAAS